MPTQMQALCRSGRNSGKKIASPQYKHDLFKGPPTICGKKEKTVVNKQQKKKRKQVTDDVFVPVDEEEEEEVVVEQPLGSHPSKNHS